MQWIPPDCYSDKGVGMALHQPDDEWSGTIKKTQAGSQTSGTMAQTVSLSFSIPVPDKVEK